MAIERRVGSHCTIECSCCNCKLETVKSFTDYSKTIPCKNVGNTCKKIRRLFRTGYKCVSLLSRDATRDVEATEGRVSTDELKQILNHRITLKKSIYFENFTFARIRYCVSIHNIYQTHGCYVADDTGIAFLKFKLKKGLLHCYYLDLKTFEVKAFKFYGFPG